MVLRFAGPVAGLLAQPGIPITLTTDRADGLTDGSTIYYKGVQVGRVLSVRLIDASKGVTVTAEVNKNPPLPGNLHATIRTQSAFGNAAQIMLEPDGASKGTLQAGATLVAEYEGSSLIPKQFTALAEDARRQQLIQHLDQAVLSIKERADQAAKILDAIQNVVITPDVSQNLHEAMASIKSAADSAKAAGANFEKFTGKANGVADETLATMSEARVAVAKLGQTIDHFESISNKMDQGKGTAGLLINDSKLYEGLVNNTRELNATILTLQRVAQQWEQEGVSLKLK
jgi:phospholipid/cholesterol/gamma-HCH transport system substrate-binding protein